MQINQKGESFNLKLRGRVAFLTVEFQAYNDFS